MCKIWNLDEFTPNTKNINTYCARLHRKLMLLSVHVTSVVFLVWFNNFALTTGFYYTLLLKLPVLMRS